MITSVKYHSENVENIQGVELMENTLTWKDGSTSTRYGITKVPLEKTQKEIIAVLKELVESGKHLSSQTSNQKEIKCLYSAGFRGYHSEEKKFAKMTKLSEHLNYLDNHTSIYMEANFPN